ncbi:MAG: von Willebrand factor type A domain-containing protein [Bacteroidales bacterium]|nr:von Willebrand factor type A domain-containing protein [Bacteroidales bacterium]
MRTNRNKKMLKNLLSGNSMVFITLILSISFYSFEIAFQEHHSITLPAGTGCLDGIVVEQGTSHPLSFVQIILIQDQLFSATSVSDANGRFHFDSIPEGTYSIKMSKNGFTSSGEHGIKVTTGGTTTVVLAMVPDRKKQQELWQRDEQEPRWEAASKKTIHRDYSGSQASLMGGVSRTLDPCYESQSYPDYNTESYDLIEENGFKMALDNPLSTFSIDVDHASYTNVRRFLNQHNLPNKDAVRIEEMVNYFDYDFPKPVNRDPFSVTLEMGDCFWNRNHQLVMIGIQGKTMDEKEIPPANLVFLLDVSGSMDEPNKLPLLRQAFKILVNNLRPADKVAIVVYAGAAGCVLESTPGSDKERIIMALDNLQAGGSTAGGAGIKLAYQIAKQSYIRGGNNRVILATDGDFNIGASSDAEMTRLIEEKRKEGVFLSVLGFGMGNYKDSKMEQISNAGNGNYAYIDNILEAKKVFGEELWGTLYTIAKDVKIQVEFNPLKVKAYRLIGYENRILSKEDFNDDRKDAGDIGSGHRVTALYEIVPAGSAELEPQVDPLEYQQTTITGGENLMTLKLRYKEPDDTVSKLMVRRVEATSISGKSLSNDFRFASSVAAFGMILRNSEYRGEASFDKVLAMAGNSVGNDPYGYRREFMQLVEKAKLLMQ